MVGQVRSGEGFEDGMSGRTSAKVRRWRGGFTRREVGREDVRECG